MSDPLSSALEELDIDTLKARTEAVLTEDLYWFPVRHHSPGVARHLRAALREREPELLFVEAPSDAASLVRFLVDAKTKPPVAIYSSYRDDDDTLGLAGVESPSPDVPPKFASWYPLLPYSPEYVAMKEAAKTGAAIVFIDLPHHALIRSRRERGLPPRSEGSEERRSAHEDLGDDGDDDDVVARGGDVPTEERRLDGGSWENLAIGSAFYRSLAEAAGYRTWDECWDALFEAPERYEGHEAFRESLALFCAAVRATTPAATMKSDGTLLREMHMWNTITKTLRDKKIPASKAMVVCGGFHLFMKRESGPERALPEGTTYQTITPYSYVRISEHTGYGAGNRAPAFYQRLFDHAEAPEEASVRAMVDHVVAVLARARKSGELLSSADAISVTQHARMLANLRGRESPSLDDVRDALVACCCKGSMAQEGRALGVAMSAVETGSAIGRVTPEIGRLPLVHDFYRQIDEQGLGETLAKESRARFTLDLRKVEDERRSVLFHRLVELEIPYCELTEGARAGTLFRETWRIAWSPKVDAELAERNLYGDTIEAAALAKLDERLARAGLGVDEITAHLLDAAKMDLPGMVQRLEESAGSAVDQDARLVPLSKALGHLSLFESHARRKGLRTDGIGALVERCFGRACFAIPYAANAPSEEHEDIVTAIASLAEVLSGERGEGFDKDLFVENVKAARRDSQMPFLQGAFEGALTELRVKTPEQLAAELAAFAKARPEVLMSCGEFLSGVLRTSRTAILLGADAIVGAIDELLRTAAWEQFLTLLPRTRGAFEGMHDRVRVSLADRVAVRYGLRAEAGDMIAKLDASTDATARLISIDRRVAEMMKAWEF